MWVSWRVRYMWVNMLYCTTHWASGPFQTKEGWALDTFAGVYPPRNCPISPIPDPHFWVSWCSGFPVSFGEIYGLVSWSVLNISLGFFVFRKNGGHHDIQPRACLLLPLHMVHGLHPAILLVAGISAMLKESTKKWLENGKHEIF